MKQACQDLRLQDLVPYQLRHTGPSWEYLFRRLSLPSIQKKGRWKAISSMRRYEKSGEVTRTYERIPLAQREFYEECSAAIGDIMLRKRLPLPIPF